MKDIEKIKKIVPFYRHISGHTYGTEMTLAGQKGSVIFGIEEKWEHVSFSPYSQKNPTWNAMCELKDIFFDDEETVVQMHPPKSQYVNLKGNCLHLWRMKELEDLINANM